MQSYVTNMTSADKDVTTKLGRITTAKEQLLEDEENDN